MGGDADFTGVGDALAIEEGELGPLFDFVEGGEDGGAFAEGEEAGDAGIVEGFFGASDFEELEVGKGEDDDGTASDAGGAGVDARDEVDGGNVGDEGDFGGEGEMDGFGFFGGNVPAMVVGEGVGGHGGLRIADCGLRIADDEMITLKTDNWQLATDY